MEWWSNGMMHLNPILPYSITPYVSGVNPIDLEIVEFYYVLAYDFS